MMNKEKSNSIRWYFWDKKDIEMFCGHCVKDNQFWMYMPAHKIAELSQEAICIHCGWCPKTHGIIRPRNLSCYKEK